MCKPTKPLGSEWAGPPPAQNPESPNGVGQCKKDASIAAVPDGDERSRIQGVDVADYIKGSLDDDASEAEEDDELDEAETVEKEARANQR